MIAVIFELFPRPEQKDNYLGIAARLKPELEKMDGFISNERYESITNPGKFVSLSFWRDEKAVENWRNLAIHRSAQKTGRSSIFSDYHLRVCSILRDYTMHGDRSEAPADSRAVHGG